MALHDNQFLLKSLKSFLEKEAFQAKARSAGNLYNSYVSCFLNYVIATREFPMADYYEAIEGATCPLEYAKVTAQCIYKTLARQIEERDFNPAPRSIYSQFSRNFFRYGLMFNAQKVSNRSYIDFPYKFNHLIETQPENSIVKAFAYSKDKGKYLYFTPYPAVALDFSSRYAGFWRVLLDGKDMTKDKEKITQFIHSSVAELDLDKEQKKALFKDICESLDGYRKTDKIELRMIDRDVMYYCMTCNMKGDDYGSQYGEIKGFEHFDDVKSGYGKNVSERDIVLAELEIIGLCPFGLYCKEKATKIQKIGTNVTLTLPNINEKDKEMPKFA